MNATQGYIYPITDSSVFGIGVPKVTRPHRPRSHRGFFMRVVQHLRFGGLSGGILGCAGFLVHRYANSAQSPSLIGVNVGVFITRTRNLIMASTHLCTREIKAIQRAITILEKSFFREDSPAFESPETAAIYARLRLGRLEREEFHAFWLDNQHRVIASEILSLGTIDGAAIYPREIVKSALTHNAAAVLFAHNHPSGDCTPSKADLQITKKLKQALSLIDVRLIDHLVVSSVSFCSIASMGGLDD